MSTATRPATLPPTRVRMGTRDLDLESSALGILTDSTPLLQDTAALQRRLAEDGYLLLRGVQDRAAVLEARHALLTGLQAAGGLDPAAPLMAGVPAAGAEKTWGLGDALAKSPEFLAVVESDRIRSLMARLTGGVPTTFDFKWLRIVGPGQFTGAHYDVVYMGRGSPELLTVWTPFGDLGYEHGPLAIIPGSHRDPGFAPVRATYGRMDVDRDRVGGWFADDPLDVTGRYGGRWATTTFQAGDVLIFGMTTMHMSLTNTSGQLRLTADTRWQRADAPLDERWVGKAPKGHYAWLTEPEKVVPMATKRAEWGV